MSETQKVDPFDITGLVDAGALLSDQGQVVKPVSDSKDIVPHIAVVVVPEDSKSVEPSN